MHDNIRAKKAVKDNKSMVFLIPTVNRKIIHVVVYEATVSNNTKKTSKLSWQYLQIEFSYFQTWSYWYTAKNDRRLSLFVYIMQLYIQRLKSAYCLKFFKFLSYGSKWDTLGTFQNSYRKYKSLTYKLTSPEQSNHTIVMEKAKVAMY